MVLREIWPFDPSLYSVTMEKSFNNPVMLALAYSVGIVFASRCRLEVTLVLVPVIVFAVVFPNGTQ